MSILRKAKMSNEQILDINGKKRRTRVEVLAISDGKALAFSRGVNSYIELPGGGVDDGETAIEAAIRELAEEAGWVGANYRIIGVSGNWVFSETEASWMKEHGIDEEEQMCVICDAVEKRPTEAFGSEGDSLEYVLLPIERIISETLHDYQTTTDKRGRFISKHRLAIMNSLYNAQISIENRPNWYRW